MSFILHIETSSDICSVAISNNGILVKSLENEDKLAHAAVLTKMIKEVLDQSKICFQDLTAISVSKGPGSYTGLRIGVSTAKGICYALNIPLIAINTLHSLASGIIQNERSNMEYLGFTDEDFLCILSDARRMEVYTALFNAKGQVLTDTTALIVDANLHQDVLKGSKVFFAGTGVEKVTSILKNPNALFLFGFAPLAHYLVPLSWESYKDKKFEDLAYFEPFYLKDFYFSKQKDHLLK